MTSAQPMVLAAGRLNDRQWAGWACVRCDHRFRSGERPVEVGRTGWPAHALHACESCAPLVQGPPAWPAIGSA